MKTKLLLSLVSLVLFSTTHAQDKKWSVTAQLFKPHQAPFDDNWTDAYAGYNNFGGPVSNAWFGPRHDYKAQNKSYGLGLIIGRQVKEQLGFRLKAGYSKFNIIDFEEEKANNGGWIWEQSRKQTTLNIAPGLYSNITHDYLTITGGLELPLTFAGDNSFETFHESITPGPWHTQTEQEVMTPGWYSIGVGSFVGLHLGISKTISVGSEINVAFSYYKMKGIGSGTMVQTNLNPNFPDEVLTNEWDDNAYDIEMFSFSPIQPSINLSVKF